MAGRFVLACVCLLALPELAAARKPKVPPPPAVELVHLNTKERYKLRPDRRGRFSLKGWARFLRCHHTGRRHYMSPRLAAVLYKIAKHFDFRPITVVSGYRAPKVARKKGNPRSPHKRGLACDIFIDGVPRTELRDYVRTLDNVGVGYYPNSGHVHVDVRRGKAFWIDESGPDERARYVKGDKDAYLQAEAAALNGEAPEQPDQGPQAPEENQQLGAAALNPSAPVVVTPTN